MEYGKIAYTTTTSNYPFIEYFYTTIKSLREYNDFKIVVFVLDDGKEHVQKILKDFSNIEVIDFSKSKTSKLSIPNSESVLSTGFNFSNKTSVLIGPECLDYMYAHYEYDVLFRFDTDVLFLNEVDFEPFIKSNCAFGGCKELYWHTWVKDNFDYCCLDCDVYNVGLSMFRKSKQTSNMFERMLEIFESWDYKFNTFEQDAINYEYVECKKSAYDLNGQFLLATNRPNSAIAYQAVHFNGKVFKPLSLKLPNSYESLKPYYLKYFQYDNDRPYSLDFSLARKCFYSSCDGDNFIELLTVTITSYKLHNTLPIDWIVICSEEGIEKVKERTQFMSDDLVRLVYTTMTEPPFYVDYSKYNSFHWTSDKANEIFCKRIYFIDEWKNNYDLMVCVDLDCIFVDNVEAELENFYFSDCAIGGTQEPFMLNYGFEQCMNIEMPNVPYDFTIYINFGFGMLNTRYLRNNNFERFLELSRGREDFFNTQEQAYFACEYQKSIKTYDLQALVWGRINKPEDYKKCFKYKIIHFSPSRYLTDDIFNLPQENMIFANTMLFYDKYADVVRKSPVANWFRELTEKNSKRKFNKLQMLIELGYV